MRPKRQTMAQAAGNPPSPIPFCHVRLYLGRLGIPDLASAGFGSWLPCASSFTPEITNPSPPACTAKGRRCLCVLAPCNGGRSVTALRVAGPPRHSPFKTAGRQLQPATAVGSRHLAIHQPSILVAYLPVDPGASKRARSGKGTNARQTNARDRRARWDRVVGGAGKAGCAKHQRLMSKLHVVHCYILGILCAE